LDFWAAGKFNESPLREGSVIELLGNKITAKVAVNNTGNGCEIFEGKRR